MTVAVWLCALLLACYGLYIARALFAPLTVAFLVYLAFRPLVVHFEHRRIPAPWTATVLLLLFVAIAVGSIATILQPARQWLREAPAHFETLGERLSFLHEPLQAIDRATNRLNDAEEEERGAEAVDEPIEVQVARPGWLNQWALVNSTGSLIASLILIIVPAYFLLAAGDGLINNLLHILPSFGEQRNIVELIRSLQEGVGRYLGQVTLINFCLGVTVGFVMWMIHMPSPLLWGVMAMLFNFIPYIGAIAGSVVIFIVATVTFEEFSRALMATGLFILVTGIEGQLITPTVLGRTMSINPVIVLLSVAFWGWMWGVVGALVAVPLLISLRLSLRQFPRTRPFAGLLAGTREAVAEHQAHRERHAAESAPQAEHEAAATG